MQANYSPILKSLCLSLNPNMKGIETWLLNKWIREEDAVRVGCASAWALSLVGRIAWTDKETSGVDACRKHHWTALKMAGRSLGINRTYWHPILNIQPLKLSGHNFFLSYLVYDFWCRIPQAPMQIFRKGSINALTKRHFYHVFT